LDAKIRKVTRFTLAIEAETCAIPMGKSIVIFGGPDKKIYTFQASDIPGKQKVTVAAVTEEEIAGAAVYHSSVHDYVYLVAFEEFISVYSQSFKNLGTIKIVPEDIELSDIAIFQGKISGAPSGSIAYAFESDEYGKTFGISSLAPFLKSAKIAVNTGFEPSKHPKSYLPKCRAVKSCSKGGVCTSETTCACYIGFAGSDCSRIICKNNCSRKGKCVAANECRCNAGFAGDDCSVKVVTAKFETEAGGADGDDPAIWIAPTATNSKIITTTKSDDNPGLTVFDLAGKKLQFISAEEPNNVDVIYGFPLSSTKKIDLAYAGCRGDNTLWCVPPLTPS
jgi:3-phytase